MEGRPLLTFVMEDHLGHRTYAENLRAALATRDDLAVRFVPVRYDTTDCWWERIPSGAARGTLRGRREVARALADDRATVRLYNTQVPAVIGPRAARSRPYVLLTDVTPVQYDAMASGYDHRPDRNGPLGWSKHAWNRRVLRRAAAHAPWSEWAAGSLVADYGVPRAAIEVIPPGIDTAGWEVVTTEPGPVRFLFVGGDFVRKGGADLLAAFDGLTGVDAELHLVTRSPVPAADRRYVYGDFGPNDPGLRRLFARCDVFVLPSATETFGIAALEGAAAGLPVVVSAVGALAESVEDGETGFAVAPRDVPALTAAMQRLADDPELRRRLGQAGRRRAVARYDSHVNADRLVRLALGRSGT